MGRRRKRRKKQQRKRTSVSVSSGCCSKFQRLGVLNNKHLFLTVLEAGKSKSKELAGSVSGEDPLPGSWTAVFSLCPHMEERMRGLSGSLSLGHRAHS